MPVRERTFTLAESLLLVSFDRWGVLRGPADLAAWLAAAELTDLVAAGRITVRDGVIAVLNAQPPGNPMLDDALAMLHPGLRVRDHLETRTVDLIRAYLHALAAAGLIRRRLRRFVRPRYELLIAPPSAADVLGPCVEDPSAPVSTFAAYLLRTGLAAGHVPPVELAKLRETLPHDGITDIVADRSVPGVL
ncbi:hypothetical protein Val02_38120 [Virgisporangium aliadipatigenens]|uniref:Uncharacterized protein n=1 Tax=Virgisporangium aliadipatigenens TaxID=741659 RepID=A0A8J3YN86_9ACTN|nr:GPP34 family phosphoprotein [Virgisporangium aliadipatigenens]GIJ46926.1 hypothetical protein Val02_38120 [Virgisporangium aliadipatigenens]